MKELLDGLKDVLMLIKKKTEQGLFGIIQGGNYKDFRENCCKELTALAFDGFSIGGLSVGEPKEIQNEVLAYTTPNFT